MRQIDLYLSLAFFSERRSRIIETPNSMWPIPAIPEMEADNPFEISFPVVSMIPLVTIIMAVRGRAMDMLVVHAPFWMVHDISGD